MGYRKRAGGYHYAYAAQKRAEAERFGLSFRVPWQINGSLRKNRGLPDTGVTRPNLSAGKSDPPRKGK